MRNNKGLSLVETMISLLLLSLAMVLMLRLTGVSLNQAAGVEEQYSVVAVDSYMYDIYRDFHACSSVVALMDDETRNASVTFIFPEGTANVYQYHDSTGCCYKNGIEAFHASGMIVRGSKSNVFVSIKLPREKLLTVDLYA